MAALTGQVTSRARRGRRDAAIAARDIVLGVIVRRLGLGISSLRGWMGGGEAGPLRSWGRGWAFGESQ